MKELAYIFVFTGIVSCTSPQDQTRTADLPAEETTVPYQKLSPKAFEQLCSELPDEQLIDVRTPAEYESGHIAEATPIDFHGNRFEQDIAQLDKAKPVMVYCQKGGRSSAAAARLQLLGFKEVYELEGGLTGWTEAGKSLSSE